jgi:hypothetical protein
MSSADNQDMLQHMRWLLRYVSLARAESRMDYCVAVLAFIFGIKARLRGLSTEIRACTCPHTTRSGMCRKGYHMVHHAEHHEEHENQPVPIHAKSLVMVDKNHYCLYAAAMFRCD